MTVAGEAEPSAQIALADFGADDATRWENVMRRYGPPLRGYFASRVRNVADVDDLVQEVFAQLLQRASGGPIEHVQRYIFQVASNVLCDQGRRRKSREYDMHESYDEALHAIASEISMERIVIGEESMGRVNAALQKLPQRTRDVFFLRGMCQRQHEDIARVLGISKRAVQKHMAAALKHLGRTLNESD